MAGSPGPTKQRLADDLQAAGAPADMVIRALGGFYDDFESPLATPCIQLVTDARAAGLHAIAQAAMNGEYDGTTEEAERWAAKAYQDPEMHGIMKRLGLGPRKPKE